MVYIDEVVLKSVLLIFKKYWLEIPLYLVPKQASLVVCQSLGVSRDFKEEYVGNRFPVYRVRAAARVKPRPAYSSKLNSSITNRKFQSEYANDTYECC